MKIVYGNPPVYDRIVKAIGTPPEGALYTYGDTIYVPSGRTPTNDLVAHEEQHARQQRFETPESWWNRYLKDPVWRLGQETEAYIAQYEHLAAKRGTQKRVAMDRVATGLSSPMYGSLINYADAWKEISAGTPHRNG